MAATTSKIAASTSGGFPIEETHGIPLYPCNRLLAVIMQRFERFSLLPTAFA
jgi:hypothetical protein